MSLPPLFPEQSPSGIIVDPQTLERVIPESKRSDGSVRRSQKIRPGFTPQEDSRPFRIPQLDKPKGLKSAVPGWVPPPVSAPPPPKSAASKKNQKRREKKREKKQETEAVREDWEDDDEKVLDEENVGTLGEAINNRAGGKASQGGGGGMEQGEDEKKEEGGEEEEQEPKVQKRAKEPNVPDHMSPPTKSPAKTSRPTKPSVGDIADTLGKLRVQ